MKYLHKSLKMFLTLVMLALPLATPLTTVASEVELGQSDEHDEDSGDDTALVSDEEDEFEEVTIREETDVEEDIAEEDELTDRLPLVELAVRTVREEAQLGVVTRGATFRRGPGSSYDAVGNLVRGAELEILGSSGNWLRFRSGNQTGWLSADRVTQGTRVGIITRGATFRRGPGSSYAAVGNLVRGAELEILGSSGNWLRIQTGNQTGWLSADRVARGTRRGVITRGATFRHGPSSSYDAAGNLVRGAELEILGSSGNWLRFRSGNQTGWLSADRVTQGTRIGFTTMGATFRHGPGSSYDAVGTLVRGVELEILGTSANGNWLRIRVGNQTGWVSAERVTQGTRASATTMGATLRHGPGSSYDAAGTLVRGVALEVLGTSANGNWLRIRFGNQTGWIHRDHITTVIESFTASVTAYLPNCAGCTGITANGTDVRTVRTFNDRTFGNVRIIAADRRFPFGSIIYIAGIGPTVVLDRGGVVRGNVLDLLMLQNQNPWQFGRQSLQAHVLRTGW